MRVGCFLDPSGARRAARDALCRIVVIPQRACFAHPAWCRPGCSASRNTCRNPDVLIINVRASQAENLALVDLDSHVSLQAIPAKVVPTSHRHAVAIAFVIIVQTLREEDLRSLSVGQDEGSR